MSKVKNSPKTGSIITVKPIRVLEDINLIKTLLVDKPRDFAIFVLGINTNLQSNEIIKITVGQVRGLQVGDALRTLKAKKTQKNRRIPINQAVYDAITRLLATMPDAQMITCSKAERVRTSFVCHT